MTTEAILPPFPGFRDEAFKFLQDLAVNNKRDWFKPRKTLFEDELLWPLRCLVSDLSRRTDEIGLPLRGDPSKSVFRIYRDIRFSKNKDPYKKHVAAVLSRSGTRKDPGGLYVHVEPYNCFMAAGFWKPDKDTLRHWRNNVVKEPARFLEILEDLEGHGLGLVDHDRLKRLPRGFSDIDDKDVKDILRHKTFIVSKTVTKKELSSPRFTDQALKFAERVAPLLQFGWEMKDQRKKKAVPA